MSEIQVIESVLEKTARRRRLQQGWTGLCQGLLVGAGILVAAVLAYKLLPISRSVLPAAALLAIAAAITGFTMRWWRRPNLLQTARWLDDQRKLQERLSTALEVAARLVPETGALYW